jgi:cysteine desulfurase
MDNSSTTRPDPLVVEAMTSILTEEFGNPSSLHRLGARAEDRVRQARASVASLMGSADEEVFFTSGGTEANNWAILGSVTARGPGCHVVSSTVEHPSVVATLDHLKESGYRVTLVPVDGEGRFDPGDVLAAVGPDTALVCVIFVQNEIGAIEPVQEVGRGLAAMKGRRPRLHVDAVQGFARLRVDVKEWGVDLLSVSAHKIHGPKGAGALYVRKGLDIPPLLYGGGQELGLRSGTENVPGIVGFGAACRLWAEDREQVMERLRSLRAILVSGVRDVAPQAVLHGPEKDGVAPYIAHFSFPGFRGESILHALEARGVFVSTGSACSSRKSKPSPVVLALGGGEEQALGAVRFSTSRYTSEADVDRTVQALSESLKELAPWKGKSSPSHVG